MKILSRVTLNFKNFFKKNKLFMNNNKIDFLLIGLGNPGEKYQKTKHNVGFLALDKIVENIADKDFKFDKKSKNHYLFFEYKNKNILCIKPYNYINLSGKALNDFFNFRKIELTNSQNIIIHDDSDLPEGKIKISKGGGSAGHKGLTDIFRHYSGDLFTRFKIGVRPINNKEKALSFILSPIAKKSEIQNMINEIPDIFECLIDYGVEECQNRFN